MHIDKVSLGRALVTLKCVSHVEACRYMIYLDVSFL
jgi:hypothetical protein